MFRKGLFATVFLLLTSCALFIERKGPETSFLPRDQVYKASYEEVWRASNLVLQPYPLRVSNMDQGTLETDVIHGFKVWMPPYKPDSATAGQSYKLTLKILRGNFSGGPAIKVSVLKEASTQHDFFSDPKNMPTDGMEEKAILYRISREIQVERALTKAQKRKNKKI
jgi:hypothetical protein